MSIRFSIVCMVVGAALGGCFSEQVAQESRLRSQAEEDPAERSTASEEAALGTAAALQFCFTCDLDPSVHACSSIASNAQHRCNRACFDCFEFNGVEECFFGLCSPD